MESENGSMTVATNGWENSLMIAKIKYLTREQLDTPLAELELYGLESKDVNVLETQLDCVYVKDLEAVRERELMKVQNIGEVVVLRIRRALQNFVEGNQIKTVEECLNMGED